jgi:isopenicillin-N N-acyltransferase like protein
MATQTALDLIRIKGSHHAMGQQIGEATAPAIRRALENYHHTFEVAFDQLKMTWADAVQQAHKYLPFAGEHTPRFVEELEGIASGAGVDFADLLVLNCIEGVTEDILHLGCTSIAAAAENTADGHVLVGHNEDWLPDDEDNVCLIHATPDDEPPFMAIAYAGQLPNVGFNAHGIAQCCDSVHTNDVRIGVPRVFVARGTLAAHNLYEAIRNTLMRQREAGYHHLIADQSGELYAIETSARHFATIYGIDGILAHTNNYLTRRMKPFEHNTDELIGSRVRVNRANRLLRRHAPHSIDTFKTILSDHVDRPYSICSHVVDLANEYDRQKTITSVIMDLTTLEMHVCWGSPCQGDYHTYHLDS